MPTTKKPCGGCKTPSKGAKTVPVKAYKRAKPRKCQPKLAQSRPSSTALYLIKKDTLSRSCSDPCS